jgi:hypothetical protein
MKFNRVLAAAVGLGFFAASLPGFAQAGDQVQARSVVTILPKQGEGPVPVQPKDFKVQVNGKTMEATDVVPLRGDRAGLELVILVDGGARTSLGREMDDISKFVQSLPPETSVGIAYMQNGRAVFAQPLTNDRARALSALHIPGGIPGESASPYFCLSDLAKNWPSTNRDNRREAIMITDGLDPYNLRFDPEDPYLQSAVNDSIRAGVVVDSIYWHDAGRFDRGEFRANNGQSLLAIVTDNTGGMNYTQGFGNPVSLIPFFTDISKRLGNQYELGYIVKPKAKAEIQQLKVKLEMPNVKLNAPQRVLVPGTAQ